MPLLLLALLLCSCSPRQHDMRRFSQKSDIKQTDVQEMSGYSDMSAAADAGRTPDSSPAQTKTGGVK